MCHLGNQRVFLRLWTKKHQGWKSIEKITTSWSWRTSECRLFNLIQGTDSSSPINQTIALKTISKLGFSANAVWNGKEALDYLLEVSSPAHPKPDVILSKPHFHLPLAGRKGCHLSISA